MSYRIVLDSCGDLTPELKSDDNYVSVPLELEVGGERFIDDDSFDQLSYIQKVADCPEPAKTSCPSPDLFLEAYQAQVDHVYVVTLSGELSGSYNSAQLAKQMYEEQYGEGKVHVFDSRSAACGETLVGRKAEELEKAGLPFDEVIAQTNQYIKDMRTYFVLDDLETLRKNGRLSAVKALVASKLSIKPIMGEDEGTIIQLGQAVGLKKAYRKMVDCLCEHKKNVDMSQLRVMISHVNCIERAEMVREMLLERADFKEIVIVDGKGVTTTYANNGGIIVTV